MLKVAVVSLSGSLAQFCRNTLFKLWRLHRTESCRPKVEGDLNEVMLSLGLRSGHSSCQTDLFKTRKTLGQVFFFSPTVELLYRDVHAHVNVCAWFFSRSGIFPITLNEITSLMPDSFLTLNSSFSTRRSKHLALQSYHVDLMTLVLSFCLFTLDSSVTTFDSQVPFSQRLCHFLLKQVQRPLQLVVHPHLQTSWTVE